jgi:hypothetical protein
MLERFIEAVLLCALFAAVSYSVARLLGTVIVSMTEKGANMEAVLNKKVQF